MCERKLEYLSNWAGVSYARKNNLGNFPEARKLGSNGASALAHCGAPRHAGGGPKGLRASDAHPYMQPFTRAGAPRPCVNIMHDMAQLLWTQISQIHVAYLETPVKKPQPLDGSDQ